MMMPGKKQISRARTGWRALSFVIGLGVSSLPISGMAQTAAPTFDSVLACAKTEGGLQIWNISPESPAAKAALIRAFNKRFGFDSKAEWLPVNTGAGVPRIIAEAQGNKVSVDVVGMDSAVCVLALMNASILKPYPYTEVFAKEMPGIVTAAAVGIPEMKGIALYYFDYVYGLAYNTNLIKESELPSTFAELGSPKWQGKFALNSLAVNPISDVMAGELGLEGSISLTKKLIANQPVWQAGSFVIASSVSSGIVPMGISGYNTIQNLAKRGEPVGFKLLHDYIPVNTEYAYVPEKSPHPCSARLFVAWMVTEGFDLANTYESLPRVADASGAQAKDIAAVMQFKQGTAIARMGSLADIQTGVQARKSIQAVLTK